MQFLIWILAAFLLMLWSGAVWLGYTLSHLALTLPWDQATAALGQLQIPEILKPFVDPIVLIFADGSWTAWLQSFEPLMQWLGNLLKGSAGWLVAALPVITWVVWGMGALVLLALAAGGSAALWWWRKRSGAVMQGANASSAQTVQNLVKHPLLHQLRRKFMG